MTEREQLIAALMKDPASFGRALGYTKLTDIHSEWIYAMVWGNDFQTLQAHRGSYKSTCLIVSLVLIIILFPQDYTKIVRKTGTDTKVVIRAVKQCLEMGVSKGLCKAIWGVDLIIKEYNTSSLTTNLYVGSPAESQLNGYGIFESITGKHATRIFTDDIVNLSDRYSRADREQTKQVYAELKFILNPGGRLFNCGTPWHKDDCFSIMPPARKYDCYSTGLLSPEEILAIKNDKAITASLFACNYELKHINDEGALFKDPQWTDDDSKLYEGRMHIDAAYGGKDTTALTIFTEKDGHYYYYGRVWEDSVMNHYGEIQALHSRFKCGTIFCETNGDKGFLAKDLRGLGLLVNTYSEMENKFVKICTHLTKVWNNLSFHQETDAEYMRQILEFQEGIEPDDCPDSAACAARILTRPSPRLHIFG